MSAPNPKGSDRGLVLRDRARPNPRMGSDGGTQKDRVSALLDMRVQAVRPSVRKIPLAIGGAVMAREIKYRSS